LGLSMPVFWLGILLLIVFSLRLDLFPLIGGGDLDGAIAMIRSGEVFTQPRDFLAAVADVLHHLALPALALGFTLAAAVSRRARLPAGPGRHHRLHRDHHHREPRGRHALRGRRPADHVPVGIPRWPSPATPSPS